MNKGKPSRNQRAAHFGDVFGYAVWRFFPRRGNAKKLLHESEGLPRAANGDDTPGGDPSGDFHSPPRGVSL